MQSRADRQYRSLTYVSGRSIVIPNVIPAVEAASHVGETKPVWRLAFFSRLEERKGLKLFVEAVGKIAEKAPADQRCPPPPFSPPSLGAA